MPHLLCCQGIAVPKYSFALDALDLRHPRFLQRLGAWRRRHPHPLAFRPIFLLAPIFFLSYTLSIKKLITIKSKIPLVITAKREKVEHIQFFGEKYREYMKHKKMFVPSIF